MASLSVLLLYRLLLEEEYPQLAEAQAGEVVVEAEGEVLVSSSMPVHSKSVANSSEVHPPPASEGSSPTYE